VQTLLETIKCLDGRALHLPYHQKRIQDSLKKLGINTSIKLLLTPPTQGLYRCRVLYNEKINKIEYLPYKMTLPQHFKLMHSNINYDLKYENRDELNALMQNKENADEIIIVKNNLITDTSIANLCFYHKGEWLTPSKPLLKGTTRQRFLEKKKIIPADIEYTDIEKFSQIALMNAMIEFQIIENAIIT